MTLGRLACTFIASLLIVCASACAKRSRSVSLSATDQRSAQTHTDNSNGPQSAARININTAAAKELETLPGIGEGLAQRIIEHREKYGPFRRAEHLMMVRGISDKRFRALRQLITVE